MKSVVIELYFIDYNNIKKDFLRNLRGMDESVPLFLSTLKSVQENGIQDELLNKKVGRGKYAIKKKYLIPFVLMGQFCNTCGEPTTFRNWKKGTMYNDKGVLECMTCEGIIYI